jgi:NTP pyrophosphatase (non-canonical NTP hydrolase)
MADTPSWDTLLQTLEEFRKVRNWEQFHTLKDLAEAISIEAAELLEVFLWKPARDTSFLSEKEQASIREEAADILIFLIYLSVEAGFDLFAAVQDKIETNEKKYPVEKAKGRSTKYKEL